MTGPILRRTERRHLNGTLEVVEELHVGDMLSEPLSAVAWAALFGVGRNKIPATLRALGAESIGEGNARRWRLPLSSVPLRYFAGRVPTLHQFARQAEQRSAAEGTMEL